MPTRLIRDEMLESEAVLSLPIEARWFYVSILLSADDVGLFEATTFKLTRRADIRRDHGERYMEMLVDADLIRLYLVDGKRFGFIPKFRQRLQIKRLRYPPPPTELVRDDEDALNKINNLLRDPTVGQPLDNRCATDGQPSEPEPELEPEQELKPKPKTTRERRESAVGKPTDVELEVWQSWLLIRKAKRLPLTDIAMLGIRREAVNAGISLNQAITTCCERGWASFKAEWIQNQQPQRFASPADVARVTVPDQGAAAATQRLLADRERNTAPPTAEVRAKMAELLGHMKVKP